MGEIESFEVNNKNLPDKVLIASQSSEFKSTTVSAIIDELSDKELYIKVIDVTRLESIDEDPWNAVIILHTWEYNKPQEDASNFIDKTNTPEKLIVIATAGDGNLRIKGIDGISSASKLNEVDSMVSYVISKLEEKEVIRKK